LDVNVLNATDRMIFFNFYLYLEIGYLSSRELNSVGRDIALHRLKFQPQSSHLFIIESRIFQPLNYLTQIIG
jgi:hypothetical protein